MNLLRILALLVIVVGTVYGQSGPEGEEGFSVVKSKDNITISERWIAFPKTNPPVEAREVKGEFYAACDIQEALTLLKDESRIKQWQSHVSKFKVYPQTDSTWFEYSYHDIPWPVSDQDHFLIYKVEDMQKDQRIFITFESVAHKFAPVTDDADRMTLAGSWLYERESGRTKITYRILSMPSSIPRIFTDPVIRSNMMTTIQSYIKLLEK